MRIVGLKYTHDAAVAVVDGGFLRFSIEMEKVANRERRTKMKELKWVDEVLAMEGINPRSVHQFVVDGWKRDRMRFVQANGYNEFEGGLMRDPFVREEYTETFLGDKLKAPYSSFTHTLGHLLGSYALSPVALTQDDAVLLTWDGGTPAQVYLFQPRDKKLRRLGVAVDICASVYGNMGLYFGPFRKNAVRDAPSIPFRTFGDVEWPGKLMSYAGIGNAQSLVVEACKRHLSSLTPGASEVSDDSIREHTFLRAVLGECGKLHNDEDIVASIQKALGEELVRGAMALAPRGLPLILSGGAFLNIGWNAMLRASGHFASVWAPPGVNDSGSAIGAIACELWHRTNHCFIDWSVYSGPLLHGNARRGWVMEKMTVDKVAEHLASDQFVLSLRGRAEIGPRALGHRSLLCHPAFSENRNRANKMKGREHFRPLAPVCLEERASDVFYPGTPDALMLFEHRVRDAWSNRIGAAVHTDGSARLQTVNCKQDSFLYMLLKKFESLTGLPLLCNTSANLPGRGFFPTLEDAMEWAEGAGVSVVVTDEAIYLRRYA